MPEPVALPDDPEDRGARLVREPAAVTAIPAAVAANPAAFPPEPASFEPEPVAVAPTPRIRARTGDHHGHPPAFEAEPDRSPSNPSRPPPRVPATTVEAAERVRLVPSALDRRRATTAAPASTSRARWYPCGRATTRLKATGELLVLVTVLGLVVSSIIVALAVAGNQVLSGL